MRYVPALLLDAVLVLIFAAIGRASHSEDPLGFFATAWPFLVALLLGHALAGLLRARPRRPWSMAWGAIVWVVTVAGGMLLRVVSGDTAKLPFIIVATLTLAVFLLGWRGAALLVRRRRGAGAESRSAADSGTMAAGTTSVSDRRDLDDDQRDRGRDADDSPTRGPGDPNPRESETGSSDADGDGKGSASEADGGDSSGSLFGGGDAGGSDSGGSDFGGGDSGGGDSGGGDSGGGGGSD